MLKLSFTSTNFAMGFIFRSGLPPLASHFELNDDNVFTLTDA